jgi:hypothetical protein
VEVNPAANALAGIPFGAILFAAADEVALPALGLSDKPAADPLSTHLYGLVSHAVYGGPLRRFVESCAGKSRAGAQLQVTTERNCWTELLRITTTRNYYR